MDITEDNRSESRMMTKRNIQAIEDGDLGSCKLKRRKVDDNSADEESDLEKFRENPPDENFGRQPSRPKPASAPSESKSESNGAASRVIDQAELATIYAPALSSIP